MARTSKIFQSHEMFIGVWWLLGLAVTAIVVGLGDFGLPLWIIPFCILWALTAGLPTLLAVIATAVVTPFEFIPPAGLVICVAALSFAAHYAAFHFLVRWRKNWRAR
jgi:hypothetical protein